MGFCISGLLGLEQPLSWMILPTTKTSRSWGWALALGHSSSSCGHQGPAGCLRWTCIGPWAGSGSLCWGSQALRCLVIVLAAHVVCLTVFSSLLLGACRANVEAKGRAIRRYRPGLHHLLDRHRRGWATGPSHKRRLLSELVVLKNVTQAV